MERIASFTVDHNKLVPGLYYSRRDGDVVTFDLRFKKPNTGDLLSNSEMHSVEHLIATLSSANSINIGRLAPQVVYYFRAYGDLVKAGRIRMGDVVDYTVPTGNFGDILAGYFAKEMGLPVGRLICASNANDVLTEFLTTGRYDKRRRRDRTR